MLSRRQLLHGVACGCAASSLPFFAQPVFAASAVPKTTLTPDRALVVLKDGNAAFVQGSCAATGAPARIAELAKGQAPFAVIVACADSRTPPEQVFNQGLGELFIIRVAGNTVDTAALGSIEYGVGILGAPLVVVLGHTQCGAVEAAVKMVKNNAKYPGSIGKLVMPIVAAVRSVKSAAGESDLVNLAVRANVQRVVMQLKSAKPIVARAVVDGAAKVVGGIYDLQSGKVGFLDSAA